MTPPHRVACAVLMLAALLSGCGAPGSSTPNPEPSTTSSPASPSPTEPEPSTAAPASSSEAPVSADESAPSSTTASAEPKPGSGPWPPELIFGEILEAGTTTVQAGKVTLTLPAGFTETAPGTYTSSWPSASGPATITLTHSPSSGTATDDLDAVQPWARTAPVDVPQATSAAMGDAVVDGVRTWGLTVVDSSGTATTMRFSAAPGDFEDYLLYQSLCSVQVAQ